MKKPHNIKLILGIITGLLLTTGVYAQYAHKINRQRRYDEISWLVTHNANNNRTDGPSGFFGCLGGGNQNNGIKKQLQDGVRSLAVDVYRVNGELRLKHGSPNTCMMDAKNFNNIIASWLETHPLDIITLRIQSGPNLGKSGLDDIFFGRRSGYKNMANFIYNHKTFVSTSKPVNSPGDVYPKIQEMLDQKKQLVIYTETNYNSDLYRYEFVNTAQNPYRAGQVNELFDANKFVTHRGIDHKTILTINHFAGDAPTYNGDVNKSKDANKNVLSKAIASWYQFGHKPSIVVDYYNLSNGNSAMSQIDDVNKINEVRGKFTDGENGRGIRDVKTYLAEFKNGGWKKIKNIEHKGRRALWYIFYSFPARIDDNRAIFFEHPNYNFSPSFIKVGDYKGNNSRTFVKNIIGTRKGTSKSTSVVKQNEFDDLSLLTPKNGGIEEQVNSSISIYQKNSNTLKVAFSLINDDAIALEIYDLTGKLIVKLNKKQVSKHTKDATFQLSENLSGIYIVKGYVGEQYISKKIAIE